MFRFNNIKNSFVILAFTLLAFASTTHAAPQAKPQATTQLKQTKTAAELKQELELLEQKNNKTTSQENKNSKEKPKKAHSEVALTWDKLGKLAQFVTSARRVANFFDPNKITDALGFKGVPQVVRDGYEFCEMIAPGAISAGLNYGLKTLITAPLDAYLEERFPNQQDAVHNGAHYALEAFRLFIKLYDPTSNESMAERFVCNHYQEPEQKNKKEIALKRVRMATIALDGLAVISAIYTLQELEAAWSTGNQKKPINYFGTIVPAIKELTKSYESFMVKYHKDSQAAQFATSFAKQAVPLLSKLQLGGIKDYPMVNLGGLIDSALFKFRKYHKNPEILTSKPEEKGLFASIFG